MHLWIAAGALLVAGCDVVFGLERPPDAPSGRFCDRPELDTARLCEDFDDPEIELDPSRAFAQLLAVDPMGSYVLETVDPSSPPRAVRLSISGLGSPDARLSRLVPPELPPRPTRRTSFRLQLVTSDTGSVKLATQHIEDGERAVQLYSDGRVIERQQSDSYVLVAQLTAPRRNVWVDVALDLDLSTGGISISLDGERTMVPLVDPPDQGAALRIELGPHDPSDSNSGSGWTLLYDDVVVE